MLKLSVASRKRLTAILDNLDRGLHFLNKSDIIVARGHEHNKRRANGAEYIKAGSLCRFGVLTPIFKEAGSELALLYTGVQQLRAALMQDED